MALLFEIRLTHVQISLLRMFQVWVDSGRREDLSPFGSSQFQSFCSSVKALCRERLLVKHQEPKGRTYTSQQLGAYWDITDKGRALLQVIDCELKEAAKAQKRLVPSAITKQLQAAKEQG